MPNGGYLSRQQIIDADDINHADVPVPEWGGTVKIKSLSGDERQLYRARQMTIAQRFDRKGQISDGTIEFHGAELDVLLCALSICDAHGNRMFDEEEVRLLGKKSAQALERVVQASRKLSGLVAEEETEAGKESVAAVEQPAAS